MVSDGPQGMCQDCGERYGGLMTLAGMDCCPKCGGKIYISPLWSPMVEAIRSSRRRTEQTAAESRVDQTNVKSERKSGILSFLHLGLK